MELIWRSIVGLGRITRDEAEKLYTTLILIVVGMACITFVMWLINIAGWKEVNYVFFFLGGLYLVAKALKPATIGAAAVVGAGVQGLRDEDLSQGAVKGLQVLCKIALGFLLAFWVLAGVLATWSFEGSGKVFFPIAAATMVIMVTIQFFEMKAGIMKWIIIGYSAVVILVSFYQTVPEDWKFWKGGEGSQQEKTLATEGKKRITAIDVVIPAKGAMKIDKQRRCFVDSFDKEKMALGIVLKETNGAVLYGSTHHNEIRGKIWFFDEGGNCVDDYKRLLAAKAFI